MRRCFCEWKICLWGKLVEVGLVGKFLNNFRALSTIWFFFLQFTPSPITKSRHELAHEHPKQTTSSQLTRQLKSENFENLWRVTREPLTSSKKIHKTKSNTRVTDDFFTMLKINEKQAIFVVTFIFLFFIIHFYTLLNYVWSFYFRCVYSDFSLILRQSVNIGFCY
jgi:predicted unusual protein kinase regulating ubiquinone biosynthesis (AarF/ABC1/UbiB family)